MLYQLCWNAVVTCADFELYFQASLYGGFDVSESRNIFLIQGQGQPYFWDPGKSVDHQEGETYPLMKRSPEPQHPPILSATEQAWVSVLSEL